MLPGAPRAGLLPAVVVFVVSGAVPALCSRLDIGFPCLFWGVLRTSQVERASADANQEGACQSKTKKERGAGDDVSAPDHSSAKFCNRRHMLTCLSASPAQEHEQKLHALGCAESESEWLSLSLGLSS